MPILINKDVTRRHWLRRIINVRDQEGEDLPLSPEMTEVVTCRWEARHFAVAAARAAAASGELATVPHSAKDRVLVMHTSISIHRPVLWHKQMIDKGGAPSPSASALLQPSSSAITAASVWGSGPWAVSGHGSASGLPMPSRKDARTASLTSGGVPRCRDGSEQSDCIINVRNPF